MNVKKCPHCGKELPEEMQFCPYCMKKLIEEKTVSVPEEKKRHSKWVIPIIAMIVLIVAASLVWIFHNEKPNDPPKASETSSTTEPQKNYDHFIGLWQNEDASMETGGLQLEIVTVKNGVMRFNLLLTSAEPFNRVARVDNATGQISDDIVTFTFSEDGWGNGGTGKIKLTQQEIYVETSVTTPNPDAMWSLSTKKYLQKQSNNFLDLDGYLTKDFKKAREDFGEEVRSTEIVETTDFERRFFDNLTIDIDPETGEIEQFTVDYSTFDKRSRFFRSINGLSTYEDVIAEFGQPVMGSFEDSGEIGYGIQNGFIKIYIDQGNMQVTGFSCFTQSALL